MSFFKKIFEFYIHASIHVAMAVFALIGITEIYFDIPFNQNLNYFIFFGTITGYNFVKYAGVAKLHHKSLTGNLKVIQIFSLGCFLAMCYYMSKVNYNTLLIASPFVILTVLYAVPFLSGFEKNLREISYLKIIVVALVWSGFTVFIPLFDAQEILNNEFYIMSIQRFMIVIVLILPFDLRDVQYDAISLQTIPKRVGAQKTKRLGVILLVIALILEYLLEVEIYAKNAFMLFFFSCLLFLMRAGMNQSKYYSSFWVESLPIFWWLILLFIS